MALIKPGLKPKKGVSLPELLIGLSIVSFISLSMYSVFFAHQRIYFNQEALIGTETQNKLALDEITRYAREGLQFSDQITYLNPNTKMGFRLTPLDPSGNPYSPGFFDNAIFEWDSVNKTIIEYGITGNPAQTSRPLMKRGSPAGYMAAGLLPPRIIATGVTVFNINYPGVTSNAEYLNSSLAEITLTTESKTVFGKTFTSTKNAKIYIKK